jgi:DUF2946 family protein
MGWFRARRRFAGWVALFALLVQFGLSFGHVHGVPASEHRVFAAAKATPPTQPATGDNDDYCAICAVMAMLSGAQTATAPFVVLPIALAEQEISPLSETPPATLTWRAFRSRAPPTA